MLSLLRSAHTNSGKRRWLDRELGPNGEGAWEEKRDPRARGRWDPPSRKREKLTGAR